MDLSEEGQKKLTAILVKRFSEDNIDRVAEMATSNSCEGFWGLTVKYTEGKRLNLDRSDYWKSILDYCFCKAGPGNVERTIVELSHELGLEVMETEVKARERRKRNRERDVKSQVSAVGKLRREQLKVFKALKQGKEDAKTRYQPGKVPLKESAKTK